jgi:hypothetical protein
MRKIAIAVCVALILAFSFSLAADYSEYINIIQKFYRAKSKDENVVNTWKEGVEHEYQATLDHLVIQFEFVKGIETTSGKIVIAGILTSTGYCIRDGIKIRISQAKGVAILITKDGKMEKRTVIKEGGENVIETGWNGQDL